MSDAGGQLPDGLELLRLAQLFFQDFAFGDVGAGDQKSRTFAAGDEVDINDRQPEEAFVSVSLKHHVLAILRPLNPEP